MFVLQFSDLVFSLIFYQTLMQKIGYLKNKTAL